MTCDIDGDPSILPVLHPGQLHDAAKFSLYIFLFYFHLSPSSVITLSTIPTLFSYSVVRLTQVLKSRQPPKLSITSGFPAASKATATASSSTVVPQFHIFSTAAATDVHQLQETPRGHYGLWNHQQGAPGLMFYNTFRLVLKFFIHTYHCVLFIFILGYVRIWNHQHTCHLHKWASAILAKKRIEVWGVLKF